MAFKTGRATHRTPHATRSKRPLTRFAADRIFGKVLAITEEKLDILMALLGPRLAGCGKTNSGSGAPF